MGAAQDGFRFFAPLHFFQKSGARPGQQRRIGGVISTEELDKHGEVVIQKGLDFSEFLDHGWYNDNHSQDTDAVLGYPDPQGLLRFRAGERLPDGTVAKSNGTWAEGYLVDTPRADRVWELGRALAKAGGARRLGFSIEGKVTARDNNDQRIVAKARVRNVAITNCPVGYGTRLEFLAKSLVAIERGMDVTKALSATGGEAAPPGVHPSSQGPTTGEGAGRILQPQSLESDKKNQLDFLEDDEEPETVTKAEAILAIRSRYPGCSEAFAVRAYNTLTTLSELGKL